MATRLDTDVIQLRTIYARTPTNAFIPSSFILISGGNGTTNWNSVSSLVKLSSFTAIKGNTDTTLYADLSNSLIQISTTGIANTFQSYIDPATSTLMLSNSLPPFIVSNGSVATVNDTFASIVPNSQSLLQVTEQSSIKILSVGDIRLSTINTENAVFISISSFTSAGYSTISGETFAWRPTLYSTLSTAYNRPSFVSSIPYTAGLNGWNWGSNLAVSTTNRDLYFSSITFNLDNIVPYIDVTRTSSSRIFVEYNPMLIMPPMVKGTELTIKEVSTFIQMENGPSGLVIFNESINTNYMTSQQFTASGNLNYFTPSLTLEINPYSSLLSNYALNGNNTINLTIYHRFVECLSNAATDTGFDGVPTMTNLTAKKGGLFVNLNNQSPTF